jgi:hypothetical protein
MLSSSVSDISERKLEDEKFRVLFEYSSSAHLLFDVTVHGLPYHTPIVNSQYQFVRRLCC